MSLRWVLATVVFFGLSLSPSAEAQPERWSLGLNAQLGSLLAPQPALGAQVGYLLPLWDDRLQLWGAYSPWTQILTGSNLRPGLFGLTRQAQAQVQTLTAGARWYFKTEGLMRPSLLVGAGVEFTPGGQILTRIESAPNPADTVFVPDATAVPAQVSAGILMLGAGMDLYPLPHWSIGGDLLIGTPAPVWLLRLQLRTGIHF